MRYNFLLSICLLFLLLSQCNRREKYPEYIIFSGSYFGITEIEDINAAVLITDKDSIRYFKDLFYGNDLETICPCGFNYRIQFFNERGTSIENHFYYPSNTYIKNNDKIKAELEALSLRMHNNPTHYIYNVEVDGDPYFALNKIKSNGFWVFIMNDEDDCPSTVQILYNNNLDSLNRILSQFPFVKKVDMALNSLI